MWDIARQMRTIQEENKKFQEESDRLREAIEELEHENEALKLRGQKDDAEIRRRDEALRKAQEAIDKAGQEVQRNEVMYQDARAEAQKHQVEVERLRQQLATHGNAELQSAEQSAERLRQQSAAFLEEQSAELQSADFEEDRSGNSGDPPQRRRLTAVRDEVARREQQELLAKLEEASRLNQESGGRIRALEDELAKARRSTVSLRRVSGSENNMREDCSRQELRLFNDLKGVVEPPVLLSMEAMELSWQEFKRLL